VDRGILWKLEVALGQQKSVQACSMSLSKQKGQKEQSLQTPPYLNQLKDGFLSLFPYSVTNCKNYTVSG
jgi:hypothetical protein